MTAQAWIGTDHRHEAARGNGEGRSEQIVLRLRWQNGDHDVEDGVEPRAGAAHLPQGGGRYGNEKL